MPMSKNASFHSELRKASWRSSSVFAFLAWVYPTDKNSGDWSVSSAWLENEAGDRFPVSLTPVPDALANDKNKLTYVDAAKGAFKAAIDFQELVASGRMRGRLTFKVSVGSSAGCASVTLSRRYRWGSARTLAASDPIRGNLVVPDWGNNGLSFTLRKPAVSCRKFRATPQGFSLDLQCEGDFAPSALEVLNEQGDIVASSALSKENPTAHVWLGLRSRKKLRSGISRVYAIHEDKRRLVHVSSHVIHEAIHSTFATPIRVSRGSAGVLRLEDPRQRDIQVDSVDVQNDGSPLIRLGCIHGLSARTSGTTVELVGNRTTVPGRIVNLTPTSLTLEFRLLTRGEGRGASLPSGGYRIRLRSSTGKTKYLTVSDEFQNELYGSYLGPIMNLRLESTPKGEFYLHADAPKTPEELGAYNQSLLAAQSAYSARIAPNDFYFESWFGKSVSDNQLPLLHETQALRPNANIRVGVIDYSVAVPAGTSPVVIGTREWWQALHCSRYVISNSWLPNGFIKQPGQVIVQTWHGTPLKFLGLDRPDAAGRAGRAAKLKSEANEWDLLVSQNAHSSASFQSAYGYEGEIAEVGYPRNDELISATDSERRQIRRSLGIDEGEIAILYAPTWRESDKSASDFLDVPTLSQKLGAGYKILLRGHSVTLRRGTNIIAPGVLDVTGHPGATDLMIAADALITDYSSIMFDFTVTGKPIVFFTPDYDEYTAGGRGVYFDLRPLAPGPLAATQAELLNYLRDLERFRASYASSYEDWRRKFNPWDDGQSSRKLMKRILELGESSTGE